MSAQPNKSVAKNATTSQNPGKEEVVALPTVEIALKYAQKHNFHVLPCAPGDKRPSLKGGYKAATNDPIVIGRIFKEDSNLGIRTGSHSGAFVLDIDMPGGDESLAKLIAGHGDLPETVMATTPSGGKHYYLQNPEGTEINRLIGKIGKKIDILGEGSYVLASPSRLPNGSYEWMEGHAPWEIEIAEAPDWLLSRIEQCSSDNLAPLLPSEPQYDGEEIIDGERNNTLASLAGKMRSAGFEQPAILAALTSHNEEKCWPPLADSEVEQIAKSIARYPNGTKSASSQLPYVEFPVDELPSPLKEFVSTGAEATGCDASYIAIPLLVGLASAIGNSYEVLIKNSWKEPSNLWGAIIGESGTMKSPAIKCAIEPLRAIQQAAADATAIDQIDYENELLRYEKELTDWKKKGGETNPPDKPQEPIVPRTYADDLTIEALGSLLSQNPNGMLIACDELSGWLGSFDRYSNSGGEVARWLSMYGADRLSIDRKGGDKKHLEIERASVCIAGGIQPSILRQALGQRYRDNGLAARFLLALPPRKAKVWNDTELDESCKAKIQIIYDRLHGLGFSKDGPYQTVGLPFSKEAKAAWIKFFNRHNAEQSTLTGDLASAYSKFEGRAARIALVFHLVDWVNDPTGPPGPISLNSMERGIRLIEWFKNETHRIYAILDGEEVQDKHSKYVEKIRDKGGKVTPSEFNRMFPSDWSTSDGPEKTLEDLKQRGFGHWEPDRPGAKGGRPTRRFVLNE